MEHLRPAFRRADVRLAMDRFSELLGHASHRISPGKLMRTILKVVHTKILNRNVRCLDFQHQALLCFQEEILTETIN